MAPALVKPSAERTTFSSGATGPKLLLVRTAAGFEILEQSAADGILLDLHYFDSENHRLLFDEARTAGARDQLVRDLNQTQPNYIMDELGAFNPGLSIEDYPELIEVMKGYKYYTAIDRFIIYRKRDQRRKGGSIER